MIVIVVVVGVGGSNGSSPTSKALPTRGVGRGLRTLDSRCPQTTVLTVCPRINHPVTTLPEPYLIAVNPLMALELLELLKAKPDLPEISQPGQIT